MRVGARPRVFEVCPYGTGHCSAPPYLWAVRVAAANATEPISTSQTCSPLRHSRRITHPPRTEALTQNADGPHASAMGRESSRDRDSAQFLRLEQFLDLESRWRDADSPEILAHRICATAAMLLDTPNVAIGLDHGAGGYRLIASEGDWPETPGSGSGSSSATRLTGQSLGVCSIR